MANSEAKYFKVKCSSCGEYDVIAGGYKTHKCSHCGYRNTLNYDEAIPATNPNADINQTQTSYYDVQCPNCKEVSKVPEGLTLQRCPACGKIIPGTKTAKMEKDVNKISKIIGWVFVAIIIVVIYLISTSSNEGKSKVDMEVNAKASIRTYMRENLNDPGSYKPEKFLIEKTESGYIVIHEYRAKNAYGGYVLDKRIFELDENYRIKYVY